MKPAVDRIFEALTSSQNPQEQIAALNNIAREIEPIPAIDMIKRQVAQVFGEAK